MCCEWKSVVSQTQLEVLWLEVECPSLAGDQADDAVDNFAASGASQEVHVWLRYLVRQ